MNSKSSFQYSLLLLLTAFIWGMSFVAQSAGMEYIGPFAFNGIRLILGGLALLPVALIAGKRERRADRTGISHRRHYTLLGGLLCGIVLFAASNAQQIGLQYSSAGKAGFITAFYIVLVPVIGLFFKKRVAPRVWIAVLLALGGLYFLCMKGGFSVDKGDIWLLAGALLFAAHILVVDHFAPRGDALMISCLQLLLSGIISVGCMFLLEQTDPAAVLTVWKEIFYAGVISSGLGYTFQIIGQKKVSPTLASLLMSMESCFSVLGGWLVLHQALSGRELLGCALMFVAILLAQLPGRAERQEISTEP